MRELVTIQLGNFANFIGSHFWNFQDELIGLDGDPLADPVFKNQHLNMDVLYRSGETLQGISTYAPRLLSIDLPGSLGSLSSKGTLYCDFAPASPSNITWRGGIATHGSEPCKKNLFLQRLYVDEETNSRRNDDLDKDENGLKCNISDRDVVDSLEREVKFWTDFSKVHYHPQSLYELSGIWTEAFNSYGAGRDAFSDGFHGENIIERLRFFVEECDHIQGFQFIVDESGGFTGVAAEFLENIADTYTNVPVLLYSARCPANSTTFPNLKQSACERLHEAVSFSRLSSFCNLLVPIGLPFLSRNKACKFLYIKDENLYHSSAVYASALHSTTRPFLMEHISPTSDLMTISGTMGVSDMLQTLSYQTPLNPVAILDLAMPTPSLNPREQFIQHLQPLMPEIIENMQDPPMRESITVLGAFDSGVKRASISQIEHALHSPTGPPRISHITASLCPLPIPLPFPSIFKNSVGPYGELCEGPLSNSLPLGSLEVNSVPLATRLRSSSAVLPFLEKRLGALRRFGAERGALGAVLLRSWGFGGEDVDDMVEYLLDVVTALDHRHHESESE